MKGQKHNKKGIVIGVTGSFGSGKTTVARQFQSIGAKIIDADKIAHRVIQHGTPVYKRIINIFGQGLLTRNKTIDRNKLARIVFNNKNSLRKLNRIIHPEIIRMIKNQIKKSSCRVVVLDAPLLIEAGLRNMVDRLIVVKINRKKQIERIMRKTTFSKADILTRIRHQIPLCEKARIADFVIDNSGTINNTKKQIIRIWRKLQPQMSQIKKHRRYRR